MVTTDYGAHLPLRLGAALVRDEAPNLYFRPGLAGQS